MGNIFKSKKAKAGAVMATAPEEPESVAEIEQIETLAGTQGESQIPEPPVAVAPVVAPAVEAPVQQVPEAPQPEYREIPVIMSESQKWNMVVENNIMLKEIIAEMRSD